MDGRFVKKFLVPSCIVIALSTMFVYELKHLTDLLLFKKKHFLIIGILSAPENFQQRLSIRKTWLQLLSEISGNAYFIIGNEICEVPPYDRVNPYSCVDRPFVLPPNATPKTEFTTLKIHAPKVKSKKQKMGFIGFGFYVRSSIIVKKLGILKKVLQVLKTEVQVKLVSAINNNVLASVTFSSELVEKSNSTVLTKVIKPVKLLPAHEAIVKLEVKNTANVLFPACDFAAWQHEPYVIDFIQLWQESSVIPRPFSENSCTFSFITYTVIDTADIEEHSKNRMLRLREWYKHNQKLSLELDQESKFYSDILFVDVIDVYRNLSRKMIDFYKSILDTEYFHYVLKADDDSFVDLLRVYSQLRIVSNQMDCEIGDTMTEIKEPAIVTKVRCSKYWWWSFFKEFWKVERSGKWREDQYRSASYPTFPCGGGYVLNKGIVNYITDSRDRLHHFQGEDVSIGIWLSPLLVTQYKTPKIIEENSDHLQKQIIKRFKGKQAWANFSRDKQKADAVSNLCEWTCGTRKSFSIPLCNKVQLSVPSMYETWEEYISKGYL